MAIITISRGTFSGGQALAEQVAERLGYQCIGREEILHLATTMYGVPVEKIVAAMDEPPAFWERLISERAHFLSFFRAALFERARRDNLIYHGYFGNLSLTNVSHAIRVRVIVDMEVRIGNAMQRHNLGRSEAIARIKRIDKDRAAWTRFLHGVDWQDAMLYDAVLNLTRMTISGACDVVARMSELEAFKPTIQSLKTIEDLALGTRTWATLAANPLTAGSELQVTADGGVVTVTGSVVAWEILDAIPMVAGRVEGVEQVRCDVKVTPVIYAEPM